MIHDPIVKTGPWGSLFLGKSGMRVSRLCLGTMTFGSQVQTVEAHRMMDLAFDRGIYFFDSANAYNAGEAERILGKWAKRKRNQIVISTKVRYQVGDDLFSVGLSRRTIRNEVENSLRRLKMESIDLLYLHQPDQHTDLDETIHVCDDLIHEGKVHSIGLSNFAAWQVAQIIERSAKLGTMRPWAYQVMYNLLVRNAESELIPCCQNYNVSLFAYNPLAAGLLTGKHKLDAFNIDGRFGVLPYYKDRYWHGEFFKAIEQLRIIAEEAECSMTALSYRWLIQNQQVAGIVIGASSFDQLRSNIDIMDHELSADILAKCDSVWRALSGPIPSYNR